MRRRVVKIIISFILFLSAIIIPFKYEVINQIIFVVSYILVGYEIVKEAIENILEGKFLDENFLMTIATLGAFCIGEFPEAVAVMLFYQVGEMFQSYAVGKSRKSISNLMDIRPDYANVLKNNEVIKTNPDEVKINDIIVVKPGEKVPLDGIVVEGNSMLDTMALTGETVFRSVGIGEDVLSKMEY